MEYLLDIVFIVVAIALMVLAARKGFVKALLDGFSTIISGFLAYLLAEPVSGLVYNSFVRGFLKNELSNALSGSSDDLDSVSERVAILLEKIPEGAINFSAKFGFNINAIAESIVQNTQNDKGALIEIVMTNITDKVMLPVTEAVVMVVLFILVSIVLSFVIRLLDSVVSKIPVIRETDKLFGALLGAIKAVVIIFVVCTILFVIVSSSDDQQLVTMVTNSKIFEFVNNNNPLLNIFN